MGTGEGGWEEGGKVRRRGGGRISDVTHATCLSYIINICTIRVLCLILKKISAKGEFKKESNICS